ncbi:hypothetical protein GVAV_003371 [Gurleya vavrai]
MIINLKSNDCKLIKSKYAFFVLIYCLKFYVNAFTHKDKALIKVEKNIDDQKINELLANKDEALIKKNENTNDKPIDKSITEKDFDNKKKLENNNERFFDDAKCPQFVPKVINEFNIKIILFDKDKENTKDGKESKKNENTNDDKEAEKNEKKDGNKDGKNAEKNEKNENTKDSKGAEKNGKKENTNGGKEAEKNEKTDGIKDKEDPKNLKIKIQMVGNETETDYDNFKNKISQINLVTIPDFGKIGFIKKSLFSESERKCLNLIYYLPELHENDILEISYDANHKFVIKKNNRIIMSNFVEAICAEKFKTNIKSFFKEE